MNLIEAFGIEIRRLEESDRAAWEDLWQENLDHFSAPERARADMPLIWQRLMDETAPLLGWLVLKQGRAAGLAHVILRQHSFSSAQVAILEDLWIAPFARRHGLAERLVERLVREGRERGWRRIEWETGAENLVAQRLYDRIATLDPVKRYRIDLE
ncbi:GNAT family N-acetyltransferase [Cereibacter johrii]|uniref:GNAT family N-acetyltransferase n=1 Tax=Cereibacter johrii TaxID=445629 RepID=UPI002B25F9FF|nr:GNAT family N-acetyltransferase [Cereibacter johrii]MEA5161767.1 GNAT family N-acetyltransferase [Cereibacter johrii]